MSGPTDPFDDMERLFDQLTDFGGTLGDDVPVDVRDEGDAFVVLADLPGYAAEDIDVQLADGRRLTVTATRESESTAEEGTYVRRERPRGTTSRTVALPEAVDENATEASYDDGVLTVRLGKRTAGEAGTDIPVN
ncbi:MAG: heat-shock protein [Halobacteriales archaeon SW_9_67_25]|jgi:HSP20 family protein|nr:MAG: heat-shock protein [Halobacteriales archaeon SW_9_67_25]